MDGRLAGGGLLFGDPRFHDLNDVPAAARWRHEHRRDGVLVGVLDGVVTDGVLLSGHSAPLGGPDLVRADAPPEDVVALVEGALAAAREQGLRTVRIRTRPAVYAQVEPVVQYALLHAGFQVEHCDLNQHLNLSAPAVVADPALLLDDRKRRYLRKLLREPHRLVDVGVGEGLARCHAVLAANRVRRGRPPGLSLDYLTRAAVAFPDRVRCSVLEQDGEVTAAAVVYRVLDDVAQVVHWAEVADTGQQPMTLLAHLLTRRAVDDGMRVLDLGPSTEKDGRLNPGLARFKRGIGAAPSPRTVLVASPSDGPRLLGPV